MRSSMGANHTIRHAVRSALRNDMPKWLIAASMIAGAGSAMALGQEADASPATAQQAPAAEELEEVVVSGHAEFFRPTSASSATKFDLPVHDTPQAIAVLTDDILDNFGARNLYDIGKFVAGVQGSPNAANTNFFLGDMRARGFSLDDQSGYKINGFSTVREFQPDLVAVERIEFLKGPSSVLYGVNGYGGTVNTVFKRPLEKREGSLRLEGGSYDNYRVEGDITGPITADARLRYRIASAYQDGGSIQHSFDSQRLPVFAQLEYELSPQTMLDTYVFWQKDKSVADFGSVATLDANGNFIEPFDLSRKIFNADPDVNRTERESYQVFASGKHKLANGYNVQLKLGHTENKTRYRAMYLYNYGYAAAPTANVYFQNDYRWIRSSDAELTFGGDFDAFGREHTFLVSGELRSIKQGGRDTAFDNLGVVDMFDPDFSGMYEGRSPFTELVTGGSPQDEKRKAIAGQVLLRPFDRWSVLLGGRVDWIDLQKRNFAVDPDPNDGIPVSVFDVVTDSSLRHFTPRAGVVFEVSPQVNAFFSFTQGFIPQEGIQRSLKSIAPEEGDQYELGLKGEFMDKRLGAALTAFYVERNNVGVRDPDNVPGEDFVIDGRSQEHKGIELEVIGQPRENLNVILTYAYLDAVITRDNSGILGGSAAVGAEGNSVYGSPKNSGSFFVQYEIPGGAWKGLSLGAGAHYESKRANQDADVVSSGFRRFFLRDFTTVDANIRYYGFKDKVIGIEATNLLDEDYFQVGDECCGGNYLQRGTSRELRAFVEFKF